MHVLLTARSLFSALGTLRNVQEVKKRNVYYCYTRTGGHTVAYCLQAFA
jgi:hypothetical protein